MIIFWGSAKAIYYVMYKKDITDIGCNWLNTIYFN